MSRNNSYINGLGGSLQDLYSVYSGSKDIIFEKKEEKT